MSMDLAPSEFAIALTIGATAYIGIFHLSFWRGGRGDPVHAWVALWCATCVAFQSARFVQLHSLDPATAMPATRAQVALAMLLITSLIGFARTLADGQVGPRLKRWMVAACAIHVSLALGTSFYVTGRVDTISDWFGRSHLASPTSPMILLLLPMKSLARKKCAAGNWSAARTSP